MKSLPLPYIRNADRCGTNSLSLAQKLAAEQRTQRMLQEQTRNTASTTQKPGAGPNVGTWFHVVSYNKTVEGGNVPDSWIAAQLDVLNAAYAGKFKFHLLGTTRTVNPDWGQLEPWVEKEREVKSALRRGTMATLNLFIAHLAGYLGWATFPFQSK